MSEQYRPQSFQILPPVVKNLLIINAIFFLATISFAQAFKIDLSDILGLHYPTSQKFKLWQFITYMFMHGSISHIFFNMFALWMFGSPIENYWGGKKFLQFYLICGIGAAVTHYTIFYFQSQPVLAMVDTFLNSPSIASFENLVNNHVLPLTSESATRLNDMAEPYNELVNKGNTAEAMQMATQFMNDFRIDYLNGPVIIGASGAVFGILLAFGMTFPNSMLYIYFFLPMKAKYFVILYGAAELYFGIMENPGDNVAHFAHLGGMLFGLILILYWRNRRKRNFYN